MIFSLTFPAFDPVAVAIGPFTIRWYALAYIVSLVIGWQVARRLVRLDAEPGVDGLRDVGERHRALAAAAARRIAATMRG